MRYVQQKTNPRVRRMNINTYVLRAARMLVLCVMEGNYILGQETDVGTVEGTVHFIDPRRNTMTLEEDVVNRRQNNLHRFVQYDSEISEGGPVSHIRPASVTSVPDVNYQQMFAATQLQQQQMFVANQILQQEMMMETVNHYCRLLWLHQIEIMALRSAVYASSAPQSGSGAPWLQQGTPVGTPGLLQGHTSPSPVPAPNNQVPLRNRANNYWDNFRSYSRQNLLSTSTRSNEGVSHSPSPLVDRSHNTLRGSFPQTSSFATVDPRPSTSLISHGMGAAVAGSEQNM